MTWHIFHRDVWGYALGYIWDTITEPKRWACGRIYAHKDIAVPLQDSDPEGVFCIRCFRFQPTEGGGS